MIDNPGIGTLRTTKDKKAMFKFSDVPNSDRCTICVKDPYPENLEIYLPEYCPMFPECVKLDVDGNANELETQKIGMDDLEEIKEESDIGSLAITIREQLEEENANRYLRLRLVNDYNQLMEWETVFKNENKDNMQNDDDPSAGVIRDDFKIKEVVSRNPQYAKTVAEVIANQKNEVDETLAEIIKRNPQIELSMAGITNNP